MADSDDKQAARIELLIGWAAPAVHALAPGEADQLRDTTTAFVKNPTRLQRIAKPRHSPDEALGFGLAEVGGYFTVIILAAFHDALLSGAEGTLRTIFHAISERGRKLVRRKQPEITPATLPGSKLNDEELQLVRTKAVEVAERFNFDHDTAVAFADSLYGALAMDQNEGQE